MPPETITWFLKTFVSIILTVTVSMEAIVERSTTQTSAMRDTLAWIHTALNAIPRSAITSIVLAAVNLAPHAGICIGHT